LLEPVVVELAVYYRALADRKRIRILEYLAENNEMTVSSLGEKLRLSQPLISWHLRLLRRAGVVKTRRSGRQVFCSLNKSALRRYQEQVEEAFGLNEVEPEVNDGRPATELEPASRAR
jgi:ArsR family transcriptional regulator